MTDVYTITNTVNGDFYVGSSVNVAARFRTHKRELRAQRHHCQRLQRAWLKYGESSFRFDVVRNCASASEMHDVENDWLAKHYGKPHCYNTGVRAGAAFLGRSHNEGAKAALSAAHKGMRYRLGHTNDETHRARQSASMKGIKKSPQHIEKIRQRMLGQQYAKGRVVTDVERAARGRPVKELTTGREFISVAAAAEYFGLARANLVRTLRGDGVVKRGPNKGRCFRAIQAHSFHLANGGV